MWDIDLELAWMTPIYESWFARSSQMLEDIIYAFFFLWKENVGNYYFLKAIKRKKLWRKFPNLGLEIQALGSHVKNALVRLRRHREYHKYDQRTTISSTQEVVIRKIGSIQNRWNSEETDEMEFSWERGSKGGMYYRSLYGNECY